MIGSRSARSQRASGERPNERDSATDLESIRLAPLVESCWKTVDTADATLFAETDAIVRGDRNRLKQLLENLIRNSIEHGGDGVTIRVGDLDGAAGIYLEDDSPGIPERERKRIFDSGYSTSEDDTGFGLSIVSEIATAHGWTICATESDAGGARFEITGVEFVNRDAA